MPNAVKCRKGQTICYRVPRGGTEVGVVAGRETTGAFARAYGPRILLESGAQISTRDVIEVIPSRGAADRAIAKYGEQLLGRMVADGARDTSDAEIERTLSGCVCGPMLVALAKEMRARGLLVLGERHAVQRTFGA